MERVGREYWDRELDCWALVSLFELPLRVIPPVGGSIFANVESRKTE